MQTKNGLKFTVGEPRLENSDRNVMGNQLFNLSAEDKVKEISYTDEFEIKNFAVNINNKGKIKVSKKVNYKNFKGCYANSLSNIIIFGDKGSVFLLPAYLIENIDNNGVKLSNLIDEFNENEESIVNIFAITEFNDEESFYFISENGYVKKTMLNEFQGNYSYTKGYKLKDKDDKLINVLKKR